MKEEMLCFSGIRYSRLYLASGVKQKEPVWKTRSFDSLDRLNNLVLVKVDNNNVSFQFLD
jgi:hypothetical protein